MDFAPIQIPDGVSSWPATLQVYPAATSAAHSRVDPATPLPTAAPLDSGTVLQFRIVAADRFGNAQRYGPGLRSGDAFSVRASMGALVAATTLEQVSIPLLNRRLCTRAVV